MNYAVRYYSLSGKFETLKTEIYPSEQEAKSAITTYANSNGFRNVQFVDEDGYELRVTATTPNGRAGRNIGVVACDADFTQGYD